MAEKILEMKDIYITYKTDEDIVKAVNGLNFSVEVGETVGLVGETGAGKTTTALSIMKLLPEKISSVETGCIMLDGENIMELNEAKMRLMRGSKVSMIFQDPMTSLNPTLTVGEQIGEVIRLHEIGLSKNEVDKKVCEMLETVGIQADRRKDYPHQFSGGMKQRVVIAIALACEPKLLLADEPTTALDVTIQAQVLEMMRELKEKLNTAMILITHDLGIVAKICDKVGIMYAGKIIEFGTVEDIFQGNNHHPYTEGLFGAIPSLKRKEKWLHSIEGIIPDPTDLPLGCKFHTRCPKCMEKCKSEEPLQIEAGTHSVSCFLYE